MRFVIQISKHRSAFDATRYCIRWNAEWIREAPTLDAMEGGKVISRWLNRVIFHGGIDANPR